MVIERFDPLDVLKKPIKAIEKPINGIAELAIMILKLLVKAVMMVIWLLQFTLWFVVDFLNPITLSQDLIGGVNKITRLIVIGCFDIIMGVIRYIVNSIFTPLFSGNLMGWDSDIPSSKKDKFKDTSSSKCGDKDKEKCYKTKSGEIPVSILIATVLCPPMGVFMQYGLSYWLNIIFCSVLTLLFYFPGLFYALLLLYN